MSDLIIKVGPHLTKIRPISVFGFNWARDKLDYNIFQPITVPTELLEDMLRYFESEGITYDMG